jgi:hypothetical protein
MPISRAHQFLNPNPKERCGWVCGTEKSMMAKRGGHEAFDYRTIHSLCNGSEWSLMQAELKLLFALSCDIDRMENNYQEATDPFRFAAGREAFFDVSIFRCSSQG